MLKDITIGQYFPGTSFVHKIDPRMKIILTTLYIIMLFVAQDLKTLCVGGVLLLLSYAISKISLTLIGKSLKPILPIIIFTAILNLFFIDGEVIFSFWIFKISKEGIALSIIMTLRIILLISGTSLLTYTTSPIALTDGIERLLSPLKKVNMPVHELAMMMTIALRFIPTLIEETEKIMSAQKARGADMETGGIVKRSKAMLPILIPLFVSAFRRADELALAMECRCYRGGEGRTRMKQLHLGVIDFIALFLFIACFILILVL